MSLQAAVAYSKGDRSYASYLSDQVSLLWIVNAICGLCMYSGLQHYLFNNLT